MDRISTPDELSLRDALLFVRRYWRLFMVVPAICSVIAVGVCWKLPNQYAARSLMMIPSPIGAAGGASILLDGQNLGKAVDKFDLITLYQVETRKDAMLALLYAVKANPTKEGLLDVMVTDTDPARAAALANFLTSAARQQMLDSHITEQSKRLSALQQRLYVSQEQLRKSSRMVSNLIPDQNEVLSSRVAQLLRGFAGLDAQMSLQEGAKSGEAMTNLQSVILQLRAEQERISPQVHRLSNEQLVALREYYFDSALVNELQKQIMVSRVLAEQDVQVVLPATIPLEKSGPKRVQIVMLTVLSSLLVVMGFGLLRDQWLAYRK
ncbi:hypothetical protein [Chromobacterium alticapitis]|uniref:Polysaccharide chain length determinant N-terminal domain-containing protein n=1 Tax=Chromobacterium alticapitis TaxID=2073169 RepID=A0A2S5DDD4_9NEIS|nr:hypothetical protein [Chromobacterium alticapitis]POZ61096.1 hypothetical protein C2I19_15525 [Chromobacterium alticapitis]